MDPKKLTAMVLVDVLAERMCQNELWGDQQHEPPIWLAILMEEVGELARALLQSNDESARYEAIQAAAVAVALVECLDRQQEREGESDAER